MELISVRETRGLNPGMLFRQVFLALVLLLVANSAMAEGAPGPPPGKWSLGIGAGVSSSPYRGVGSETMPFPLLVYRGERLFFRGIELGYRLLQQNGYEIAVLAKYRFQGYDGHDSSYLRGMEDRQGTLEGGLQASRKTAYGQFRLTLLGDLFGEHKGYEADAAYSKSFHFEKLIVKPAISVIWQSSQLVDYYYGVTRQEETATRPFYKGDWSVLTQVGLTAIYMLNGQWAINARASMTRLPDEIVNSPIVDDRMVASGFVGVIYRF